jgi:hypothetical protein
MFVTAVRSHWPVCFHPRDNVSDVMAGLVPAIHVSRVAKEDVDGRDKHGHDDYWITSHFVSLRLPLAYSLSSQITHLPSCATYLEISGTVFCP